MKQDTPPSQKTPAQSVPSLSSFTGLTTAQAEKQRGIFGKNEIEATRRYPILDSIRDIVTEPMFLLLAVACVLYFFLGDFTEAFMMVVSILFVTGIELYQGNKSERALEALRQFTRAQVRVLRNGKWAELPSEDLVPDDIVSIEEGERIPADGIVLEQHDLSVDESVLTGESLTVEKSAESKVNSQQSIVKGQQSTVKGQQSTVNSQQSTVNHLFQGTTAASGKGVFKVTATGSRSEFGKLGKSIESIDPEKTPLQIQIKRFVRQMAITGGLAFALVFALNFWTENDVWKALLFSLTLAMAILPQEIPVAFSAFMGLGAFRMTKFGILAKQPKTVESLGSATVICLDKTGTITENKMSLAEVSDTSGLGRTLEFALWASEPAPFDSMEKAILEAQLSATASSTDPRKDFQLVKEYLLSGLPPMMTHVWEKQGAQRIIACKGAVERLLSISDVPIEMRTRILTKTEEMAGKGYRVLGVASAAMEGSNFPEKQDDFKWKFEGLVAFFDPPKKNVAAVFKKFYKAGIRVIMITGDHATTAQNIAQNIGLKGWETALTGDEIMKLSDPELQNSVQKVNVFARMFPDAKLRIVNALKANGDTVAMSGDGVNDGPALKAAQIGVAMGKKGTEIAKSAASLVLLNDNLSAMVTAIRMGRRIYDNLRKAIRYIISIHLPIVLTVLIPLLFGWQYTHILLPLHVIFLELVMDPTAAIAFENEPAEPNLMRKPPRPGNASLFSWKELGVSLFQGAMITAGVFFMYHVAIGQGKTEDGVRSMVFATLVSANLFLTLANRSFDYALHRTLFYKNRMLPFILGVSVVMLLAILYVPFLTSIFKMGPISALDLSCCALAGFSSVVWFEGYKAIREWRTT